MESNSTQSLGKRIMSLRKAAGMTQEQLAEKLGVTPQAVSKWENEVSCPDISLLPTLASIFGVSTDSLLGRAELDTEAVRAAYAKEHNEEKREKSGGIWFGVMVALAGLAFLCAEFIEVPFKPWAVIWSAVILALGVLWIIRRFSFFALGVSLLGLYYLMVNLGVTLPFTLTWAIALPAFLILLGLTILWDNLFPRKHDDWKDYPGSDWAKKHAVTSFNDDGGHVDMRVSYAESNYTASSGVFRGGNVNVSFGHGILDLSSMKKVEDGAALNVDVSFGSAEIYLPACLRADLQMGHSVGDVETHGVCDPDAKSIRINGNVSMGSAEIYYR